MRTNQLVLDELLAADELGLRSRLALALADRLALALADRLALAQRLHIALPLHLPLDLSVGIIILIRFLIAHHLADIGAVLFAGAEAGAAGLLLRAVVHIVDVSLVAAGIRAVVKVNVMILELLLSLELSLAIKTTFNSHVERPLNSTIFLK